VSRDWLLYLDDLIDSAEKVQRFLKGLSFEKFGSDEMLFDAVLNTSCPKSLSSVRRIRRSLLASRITSPSCAPGERSATARTS